MKKGPQSWKDLPDERDRETKRVYKEWFEERVVLR